MTADIKLPAYCTDRGQSHRAMGEPAEAGTDTVQVELSRDVLLRLLRDRSLVASEIHYLNATSFRAGWQLLKHSLTGGGR